MARVLVDPTETPAVLVPTAPTVDGDSLPGDGRTLLHVENTSVGVLNVTIQTGATVDGLAVAEQIVAVAAGQSRLLGPFRPSTYNQPTGAALDPNRVLVDYQTPASWLRQAIEIVN